MVEFKCISGDLWPSDKNWGFLISCLESVKMFLTLQSEVLSSYSSFPPVRLSADPDTLPSQNGTIARNFVKMPTAVCRQRAKSNVNSKSPWIRTVEVFTLYWMNRAMEAKGRNHKTIWAHDSVSSLSLFPWDQNLPQNWKVRSHIAAMFWEKAVL